MSGQGISPFDSVTGFGDPEVEFIAGEIIIKLYYWKRVDGYVTVPEDSLFKVTGDGFTLEAVG